MVKPYQATRNIGGRPKAAEPPRGKDLWDKISTLTIPFVTLVLGLLGWYATYTHNQQELDSKEKQVQSEENDRRAQFEEAKNTNETQIMERLYEFVASADPQKREFGYAMFAQMGKGAIAARIIELRQDKAGMSVLRSLARDRNPTVAAAAIRGLESLENEVAFTAGGSQVVRRRDSCRAFAENGFRIDRREASLDDYKQIAGRNGIEPEALAAFMEVETRASLLPDGKPRILFDRDVFSRLTNGRFDKTHPSISNPQAGGYGPGGNHQYDRLREAASLNCPAALSAASWGAFQIHGSNYRQAGYQFADDFIRDTMGSGAKEVEAGIAFLQSAGALDALRQKDWESVARLYNGPSYSDNRYDEKLRAAYASKTGAATQ